MGRRRKRQDKEEIAEERCFSCKDGGDDLRVCNYKNCLKVYHPKCRGNDGELFICDWHKCLNCRGSSHYQCLCCPIYSVCNACIGKVEFVQLKHNKGFCSMCLNRAILIEKNADADPDVAKTDHEDAEIGRILFKDYWEVIKDREHLSLVDLEEASALLNIRLNRGGVNSEKSPDDYYKSDENIMPDNDTNDQTILSDSKCKQDKVNTSLKNKSNKKTYVGWASEQLIEFLSSSGKDTSKPLDEPEIVEVVKGYIKQKNLYKDDKKHSFFCDNKLQPLFKRKKVRCRMIRRFLAVHLASNAVSEDEIYDGSEDDDTPVMKKKPRNSLEPKIAKRVSERSKICFASLVQNNINLIYLRRTLVVSLLSQPDTFEQKVVGCFVRLKISHRMEWYTNSPNAFMLARVAGIKKSSNKYKIKDTYTDVLLCVTGSSNDVKISELSDEDFAEDECNDLISLVKKGLLERATVAEFEEKVAMVHRDIVNHWIERELVILERNIDTAHMKGWHPEMEELLQQKKLLSTPAERQRRLEEIPEIVADTEYEEKKTELEVATSNSSQENRGAAQQVANPLNDLKEEPPKGEAADAMECLKVIEKPPEGAGDQVIDSLNVLNKESSEGAMEQVPDSLNILNKESSEVASKQGDAAREAPSEAPEACFSGAILDNALHSQMHDTQDHSPTRVIDVDREESDHSRRVVMTKDKEVEVINLDSDEDEDLPTVQHKPENNTVHAPRVMNGGNILLQRSESASPATYAPRGMSGAVCKSKPATANGVLQPELRQPAPATMNGVLPPEQRKPTLAAMNGVLHPEQCKPAPAAKNRVSPHEPLWHYVDPQGDPRGPFALVRLSLWRQGGFFDEDFRVWMTGQKAEQGILLTDALKMHM